MKLLNNVKLYIITILVMILYWSINSSRNIYYPGYEIFPNIVLFIIISLVIALIINYVIELQLEKEYNALLNKKTNKLNIMQYLRKLFYICYIITLLSPFVYKLFVKDMYLLITPPFFENEFLHNIESIFINQLHTKIDEHSEKLIKEVKESFIKEYEIDRYTYDRCTYLVHNRLNNFPMVENAYAYLYDFTKEGKVLIHNISFNGKITSYREYNLDIEVEKILSVWPSQIKNEFGDRINILEVFGKYNDEVRHYKIYRDYNFRTQTDSIVVKAKLNEPFDKSFQGISGTNYEVSLVDEENKLSIYVFDWYSEKWEHIKTDLDVNNVGKIEPFNLAENSQSAVFKIKILNSDISELVILINKDSVNLYKGE